MLVGLVECIDLTYSLWYRGESARRKPLCLSLRRRPAWLVETLTQQRPALSVIELMSDLTDSTQNICRKDSRG